jgi:HEAT repeat protein
MLRRLRQLFARPAAQPELLRQATSPDAEIRRAAADGLAASSEPWAGPALLGLLGDSHSTVRGAATDALRRLGPTAAPLLQKGLDHSSPEVARAAAELLGEVGSGDHADALLVALKYAQRPVQLAAKRALIQIGPAAGPALEAGTAETHPWVRQQIEEIRAAIRGEAVGAPQQTPA